MLFNFKTFIDELRNNPQKVDIVNNYEKYYGPLNGILTEQIWYIEYISKFFPYYEAANCPPELEDEFDWKLLFSLIVGSFSSEIELVKPNKLIYDSDQKVDINIYVSHNDNSVKKSLNELWSFQIMRLYEIYIEEQINLQMLIAANEYDMQGIYKERLKKLNFIKNYNHNFKKLEIPKSSNAKNYIYHYTNFNTINEIFKSNSLRACDIKRLNDKMEYKIWFDIFSQSIDKIKLNDDLDLYHDFLEKIIGEIETYKNYDCYVTCLSKERDLLSQWRAYGDDGQGVAIAFDTNELLDKLYKYNEGEFNLLNGFLEYNYYEVYKDLIDGINEILRNYISSSLSVNEYFNRIDNTNFFKEKTQRLFMRMQDLKDSSFFEEKEFRLFWQQLKDNTIKKVSTFERNKRIIPYIDLSFGNEKIPIKEIILGPALTEKEDKIENIRDVLSCYGYDLTEITITESNLPYRK
jgi:hypothetical protein